MAGARGVLHHRTERFAVVVDVHPQEVGSDPGEKTEVRIEDDVLVEVAGDVGLLDVVVAAVESEIARVELAREALSKVAAERRRVPTVDVDCVVAHLRSEGGAKREIADATFE